MAKILQVIPQSLVFTPANGTAVTITDFAEVVTVALTETMADIASQSSTYSIGKLLTAQGASIRTVMNNVGLDQLAGMSASATYTAGTDTLAFSGSFGVKYGEVVFTGKDTSTGRLVRVTLTKAAANVNPELSFGKDQEVRVAVAFDAVRPDDAAEPVVTIENVVPTP